MVFHWVARPEGSAPLAWPSLPPRHDRGPGAQQIQRQSVNLVPVIGFVLVALLAIAFAGVPLWRAGAKKGRALLVGAIALFMLAIGGGTYFFVGRPYLAQRSAQSLNNVHDIHG